MTARGRPGDDLPDTIEAALAAKLPSTPAGRQLAWWLGMAVCAGERATAADWDRYAPSFREQNGGAHDAEALRADFLAAATRMGVPVDVSIERSDPNEIAAIVATAKERKWSLALALESEPPHRITNLRLERRHDFNPEVREAGEADALILADIERRCPIVVGDTSIWFDRGADYLVGTRLMEDCTIGLASVDGIPAAVSCGAAREVRIGGAMKRMLTVSHLRVLPEHQRKGLWGAANRALDKYWPRVDGSNAYISVENTAMQHGFATTPNKWPQVVERVELDCAALAGPQTGRAATAGDAREIVRRLNAFHEPEEMFVPYTQASLGARLERAPDLYGWSDIHLTEAAVVGVWPAGNAQRSVAETDGQRTVSMPGVVLDYAFAPGAEDELEALLRAACGRLVVGGMDTLVVFTSPASAGRERLKALARSVGRFFMWSPGIAVPPGADARGLYTDAIYF